MVVGKAQGSGRDNGAAGRGFCLRFFKRVLRIALGIPLHGFDIMLHSAVCTFVSGVYKVNYRMFAGVQFVLGVV